MICLNACYHPVFNDRYAKRSLLVPAFGYVYPQDGRRLVYVSFQLLVNVLYILLKVTFKLLNTYPVKTRCSFILLYVMKSSIKVLDIKHLVS